MQRKENKLLPLRNGDNVVLRWWNAWIQLIVLIYFWITISQLFVFLSANPPWVNNIRARRAFNKNRIRKYTMIGDKQLQKNERSHFEQRSAHQAKTLCNLCGWLEQQQVALQNFFWIFWNLFSVGANLKESIFKSNNQSIPLLQPEHGLCQKNGSERGQAQQYF